jgi:hypothetical protein
MPGNCRSALDFLFIRMKTVEYEKGMLFFPRNPTTPRRKEDDRNIAEDVIYSVAQQLLMKEFVSLYAQRRITFMPFSRD